MTPPAPAGDPGTALRPVNNTILFSIADDAGFVTFNRPSRLNAIDLGMGRAMADLARDLPARDDVKVYVLRGEGRAFMAGGDIELFRGSPEHVRATVSELIDHFHGFTLALQQLPQPVIGSVRGAAAGAGFSLAIGTDITLASDTAVFQPAYIRLGTSPDGGATHFLTRLVGPKRAIEILLGGRSYAAADAVGLGLVNRVVADAELDAETCQLAARLAENPSVAAARTKALLKRDSLDALRAQLGAEKEAFLACIDTPEFSKGVMSFLSKQAPSIK